MTLSIYTEDFDEEDSVSDGFSGMVFVENKTCGKDFKKDSLSENITDALKYVLENGVSIDEIVLNYRDGNEQKFKKMKIVH